MRIKNSLATMLVIVLMGAGCESGKISKKPDEDRPYGDRDPAAEPKKCVSIKSLDVLKDGRTILSYLPGNNKALWDFATKRLVANSLPVNFVTASDGAQLVIGKVSGGKYQVNALDGQAFRPVMLLGAIGEVDFQFSSDSKILSVHHTLPSGLDQIDIYDLESRSLVYSYQAYNVRYVRLSESGEEIVLGYDYGWGKAIGKYDVSSFEEDFLVQLPSYLRFSYLDLSQNAIIAKVRSNFRTYSLANGDYLGSFRYGSIYAVDPKRDLVLTSSKWGKFEIRNSLSGELLYSAPCPKNAILSSCVFSSQSSVTCLKRGSNQVMRFDFKLGASAASCY